MLRLGGRLVAALMLLLGMNSHAETITIYSYHNHPPFVTGKSTGLTFDLADALQKAPGNYKFEVRLVPRARLNALLKNWIEGRCEDGSCDKNWLVPWVNPKWGFIKGPVDNYIWHELFDDSNSIVSHSDNPIDYKSPESLKGHLFAGMRGHRYVGIDDLVSRGEIKRVDGNRERDNLMKLLMKRVDATLLPTSTMQYLLNVDKTIQASAGKFSLASKKHQSYTRYMMVPGSRPDLLKVLQNSSQATESLLSSYR